MVTPLWLRIDRALPTQRINSSAWDRQIGVITGPLSLTNAKERLDGFEAALGKAKISLAPECVQEARFDLESGQKAAARLLRILPRPTAIVATNDLMALGALSAVRGSRPILPSRYFHHQF
jgi:DNA-binding LacI/PurR family transcriptional regulator